MSLYNYEFIKLPTFESTELFYRGVGDTTDIVNKENTETIINLINKQVFQE